MCLLMPGLPVPTHACELGFHAPAQPPSACTSPLLARHRTPLAAHRIGTGSETGTIQLKGKRSRVSKERKIAQKGFLFYLYSRIYLWTRTLKAFVFGFCGSGGS